MRGRSTSAALAAVLSLTVAGAAALATALPAALGAESTGAPVVSNRETVNIKMDATGAVDVARFYDQLAVSGSGTVEFTNPVGTEDLRNLDGFRGPTVEDGAVVGAVDVDGEHQERTVSTFDGQIPVDVQIRYLLDGEEVAPADLVGADGALQVLYRIENITGTPTEISFEDGRGDTVTKTVDVVTPLAGSLTTTLPASFTNVRSSGANVTGDGRGGTRLTYTLTLFPPIASPVVELSWEADIRNGLVPYANISLVPLKPFENPSISSAASSYAGGADTGAQLTDGASQIDENVLKIADGAGQLFAGLLQLKDGSEQLAAGLAGEAAPGSQELADGLSQLEGGMEELAAGVDSLPQSVQDELAGNADYQLLLGTLQKIIDGIGTPSDLSSETLIGGLNQLSFGMRNPVVGINCDPDVKPGEGLTFCGVGDANELLAIALGEAAAPGGDLDQLIAASKGAYAQSGCPAAAGGTTPVDGVYPPSVLTGAPFNYAPNSVCVLVSNVVYGLAIPAGVSPDYPNGGVKPQTQQAADVLDQVVAGIDADIVPGIAALKKALYNKPCDSSQTDSSAKNFCGISQALSLIKDGIPVLVATLTNSIADELSAGIGAATPGCDPTATLLCATDALADGAAQLADGLGAAADGSEQISDGSGQAADGASQIEDGANQLSEEGTSQLVAAGNATALDFGEKYALIEAAAQTTEDGGLPYGAPEGALATAAYSIDIGAEAGQSGDNTTRLVLALLLFAGAAVGGFFLTRARG